MVPYASGVVTMVKIIVTNVIRVLLKIDSGPLIKYVVIICNPKAFETLKFDSLLANYFAGTT